MKNDLKAIRRRAGLTQQEMAEKLGVKVATYGTWERGTTIMNVEQLISCADILDCSTDAILCHEMPEVFIDWREAELHKVWRGLDVERQDRLLANARDLSAAASVGRAGGGEEASFAPPGAVSA